MAINQVTKEALNQRDLTARDRQLLRACYAKFASGEWSLNRWYTELAWAGFTINYDTGDYEKNA